MFKSLNLLRSPLFLANLNKNNPILKNNLSYLQCCYFGAKPAVTPGKKGAVPIDPFMTQVEEQLGQYLKDTTPSKFISPPAREPMGEGEEQSYETPPKKLLYEFLGTNEKY